jgi:hypothetical protein
VAAKPGVGCGAIRNLTGLAECNAAIATAIEQMNGREMRRLEVSRRQPYDAVERPAMQDIPEQHYEYAEWRLTRVGIVGSRKLTTHSVMRWGSSIADRLGRCRSCAGPKYDAFTRLLTLYLCGILRLKMAVGFVGVIGHQAVMVGGGYRSDHGLPPPQELPKFAGRQPVLVRVA